MTFLKIYQIPLPVRLRAIAFDLTTHLDRQFDIIRDNVPHAYLSGLNWIPSTSPFWTSFFFNARVLNRTLDEHSPLLRRFAVQGSVRIFAVSPDASSIATGSYEGMLFVWDMGSGLLMHSARIYEKVSELDRGPVVISLSYSRSGHQIASSSSSSPLIHTLINHSSEFNHSSEHSQLGEFHQHLQPNTCTDD